MTEHQQWICGDAHAGHSDGLLGSPTNDDWHIRVRGCVRLSRRHGIATVTLDGRLFGWELCDRLVLDLERLGPEVLRIDFAVWIGPIHNGDGWIRHSAISVVEAISYARRIATIVSASDAADILRSTPLRLEQLLVERRGIFDEVLAAWLLNSTPGSVELSRLFEPARTDPHEGLKVVRRFGGNLRFNFYRAATSHQWIEDQRNHVLGKDLGAVVDRRLARSLAKSVDHTLGAGEPVLERVSGVLLASTGAQFVNYYRLLLPLNDRSDEHSGSVLVATHFS